MTMINTNNSVNAGEIVLMRGASNVEEVTVEDKRLKAPVIAEGEEPKRIFKEEGLRVRDLSLISGEGAQPLDADRMKALMALIQKKEAGSVQEKHPITFKELVGFRLPGDIQVSPDSTKIAFVVKENSLEENTAKSHIWIYDLISDRSFQLTNGPHSDSQPRWSPDGKSIAFVSDRSGKPEEKPAGKPNLWIIPVTGGEAKKVTDLSTGASSPVWSPDGKALLFTSQVYPDCKDDGENKKRLEGQEKSKVKAMVFDELMVRHWDRFMDGRYSHLFVVSSEGGSPVDLTPGKINVPPLALGSDHDVTFSPDGKEVCYVANTDPMVTTSTNNDLFTISLSDGKVRRITDSPGNDFHPSYSPDGKYMAYLSMERAGFESDRKRLMLYDRSTGNIRELTAGFDYSGDDFQWSPDSQKIYFNVPEKGYYRLYSADLEGKISKVSEDANVLAFSLAPSGKFVTFLGASLKKPADLHLLDLATSETRQLTDLNKEKLESLDLGEAENFWFEGAQGAKIHGFLLKPPGFDPGKKYPLLLLMHGGPQQMWTDAFGFGWCPQLFAAQGYVVAMLDRRGSPGYGQKFTDEVSGDWGGKAYEDLMKGVDHLLEEYPFIDGTKMAAAGGSYGGYMANWIQGHTDRFKCLITHCGPFNLKSANSGTDELWFPEWEFGGTPWDNSGKYEQWSPHNHAANFKTPMLIIHGQNDYRVPVEEGIQMFTILQRKGVPSRFLYFPDEGHWVLKPQNQELWYKTFLEWLEKWLRN